MYLDDYETGQQLYKRLARELNNGKRNDRLASLKLNEIGIPGLRYLDSGSRDTNISVNDRTYDYVIWNESRMQMVGIDPDSDQEAIDYYNKYKEEHPDSFITPQEIERYSQQDMQHGTPYIIENNKFDLKRAGSTMGQEWGYGVYLSEPPTKEFSMTAAVGAALRNGNLYNISGPDNDMLLDYDETFANQSEQVKKKLREVRAMLKQDFGVTFHIHNNDMGMSIYGRLSQAMEQAMQNKKLSSKKLGEVTDSFMAASLMLNKAGIPGARYLYIRNPVFLQEKRGPRNFVIWNTDLLKIMGLAPNSKPEAIEYFEHTKAEQEKAKAQADKVAQEIGAFGQETIEQYFQRWGITPARDTDEEVSLLLERNKRAEPAFRQLMDELQHELGGELITRKQMKSPERIIIKANRVFGGDISRVGDVWAGTLVFDTEDELLDAIIKFRQRDDIVHQDNRWSKPKRSTGYRDFEAHLALDDGTIVELQLQHRGIQDVKDNVGHSLYEFITNNRHNYELENYTWQAGDISKRLYAAGMNGSYEALIERDKTRLRKLGENLAQASDADEASQAIAALQKFIDKKLPKEVTEDRSAPADKHSPTLDPITKMYMHETSRSIIVPMDSIKLTENVTSRSISKAKRNMQSALNGYMSKREPLTVIQRKDGYYYVLDGNNTYSALKELGAKNVLVEVIGSSYSADMASSREQGEQASVRYDAVNTC